jgi:outer membrane protein assembly factor BamB
VALNGYQHRGGYDLETGTEIWKMAGGGDIPIPTPIVWKDLIYFNSAHGRHAPLMAIKSQVKGEVPYPEKESEPGDQFAWFYDRQGSYMSSVLVYDDLLYRLRWNGNLACFNPTSGELIYSETVNPSSFVASPVASDDRLYMVSEDGDLYIAATGKEYKLLKKIPLGEVSLVTPGIADGILVLRTASRLIGVSSL